MAETRGQRFYAVRLAAGDGVRSPKSLRDFVALVKERTGHVLHASELSSIERDDKAPTLDDVEAVASVDPLKRGSAWLAAFAEAPQANGYAIANERPVFVPRVGPRPPDPVEEETPRRPAEGRRKRRGA